MTSRRNACAMLMAAMAAPCVSLAKADTRTLRVSATPSIFKPMFQRLCAEFRDQHPNVEIELTATSRGADDQVQRTLRYSLIGELPDVSFEGLSYLRTLQQRRIAVPLNDLIRGDPSWATGGYGESLIESGSVGRTVVGLGAAVSVPIIYYNIDRVAPALRSAPMPRTWDVLLALIDEMMDPSQPGFVPGYCRHAPGNWIYNVLVQSHGGSMMSPDESRIAFDSRAGHRALEIYRAFGRSGQARTKLAREQARQAFTAGAIGILVDSSSSLATFEQQIGTRFKLGTSALPVTKDGRIPTSGIATVLLTRDPARQALAWDFMKFVAGSRGQKIIGESTGYFPANDRVRTDRDGLADYYRSRPQVAPIVESLAHAARSYSFPGSFSAKIDDVIFDEVAAVIALTRTSEQALARMKHDVTALLPVSS
jgi:multiple sugar transport system substrate-binding protein